MTKQVRIISSTGYFHVIMRGHNKVSIFKNNNDKDYFMLCLLTVVEEKFLEVTAWCKMENHVT